MSDLDDVNAAEAQEVADIQALGAADAQAFDDLEAAIKAGQPVDDLLPLLAQLKANHTNLVAAITASQAADATTKPAPDAPAA